MVSDKKKLLSDVIPLSEPWLVLGEQSFRSRLLVGTEQYTSAVQIREILEATHSQAFITTFDLDASHSSILLSDLVHEISVEDYIWLGTTSFARSAEDAVIIARMLRQSLGINIIKLDVRTDGNFPNNQKTVEVARLLLSEGFYIIPFIMPDQAVANELEDMGCSALRLMASSVGSGHGIENAENLQSVISHMAIPVIIEGGLGTAWHVAQAMELGAAAVLVNTALVKAKNPVLMATAMKAAVEAGRMAFLAHPMKQTAIDNIR
jgi:thiazole synthase